MRFARIAIALTLAAQLAACAMPHGHVSSGTERPTLGFVGQPPGTVIKVDGLPLDPNVTVDGAMTVVRVEEGMHRVQVERNGTVVHQEQIYLSGGERKILDLGKGNVK
ncbi:hypothetical protein LMG3410_03721 [Achromobacter aegrifaciens]|uniref:hypothetical protein n=1 Tax=Achromobacter aegrifaciens TaxID=1287736 RepID=UPI0014676AC6|nr:hypothetical protein [Achromobacter aegrifaciens]CAB3889140.1 hypothetical protein LMG3410_03721 [Achromobacter aegrifaciens]